MRFPPELFLIDDSIDTLEDVMKTLEPLNLDWQVRESDDGGKAAIAVLHQVPESKEIWAVAVLEKAAGNRHRHNNEGGFYGELNFTFAGSLPDFTDDGEPADHQRGSVLAHAGGTVHEPAYTDFWAGIFHQPRGSTPLPD